MQYLYKHDIIHRDLKPENILIDSFLFPKIADFGLSKMKNKLNQSSVLGIKGTPIYMSPEIWRRCEYSKASDVYAFGMIVYEILTNEKPFSEMNIFKIMSLVASGYRPQFKNPIPNAYRELIESCWLEDPNKRPTFSQIIEKLRNDKRFITKLINEKEFINFVKLMEETKASFNSNKDAIKNDNLCEFFKEFKDVKFYDNTNIKSILNYSDIKIFPYKYFIKLTDKGKKQIDETEKNPSKLFETAKKLIEGQEPFERNIEIGIQY